METDRDRAVRKLAEQIVSLYVPSDPKRHVFSILREIFVVTYEEFLRKVAEGESSTLAHERIQQLTSWLIPPVPPLSLEAGIKLISTTDSPAFRDFVLKKVGRRNRRGQPPSKRHLALAALDGKYAYPSATLREATNAFCPCGLGQKKRHTEKCREQFRQQINRAVKLMKTFGYDFTWDRIGKPGWKEKIE